MNLQWLISTIESVRAVANANKQHSLRAYVAGIIGVSALLVACGHTPGVQDVPPGANFTASILADGTKLFTFSTRLPHQQREGDDNTVRRGDDRQSDDRPRMHADMAQNNKKALQAMLLENGYCREGFVILEMFEDRAANVIRGECRDAASDADKEKYSHH